MFEHSEILNVLLSHCKGHLDDAAVEANEGYQVYVIEFSGLDFIIEAKRTSKVGYTYIIRSYDRRFKVYTSTPRSEAMASIIPKAPLVPLQSATIAKTRVPFQKPIPRSSTLMEAVPRKSRKKG